MKFVPNGSINKITALVQIMAWYRPGDKPLSEPMMVKLPTDICVTRPQWVNLDHCYIFSRYLMVHNGQTHKKIFKNLIWLGSVYVSNGYILNKILKIGNTMQKSYEAKYSAILSFKRLRTTGRLSQYQTGQSVSIPKLLILHLLPSKLLVIQFEYFLAL